MALFLNLYVGHLLGDFLFQPGRLVVAKRQGVSGLLLHTAIITASCSAVLAGTIRTQWPAVVLVASAHLAIELLTISTYLDTPTRGLFTFLFDQALHVLSIGIVVWITGALNITEEPVTFGVAASWETLAGLSGLLAVTLMGSILTFETVNAIMAPSDGKGRILRFDVPRVAGMVERGVALLAALLVHPATVVLPFAPRVANAFRKRGEERKRPLLEAGAGLVLCAVTFMLYRFVILVTSG